MTSMQDDLFGDALPVPPAKASEHVASPANPDLSGLRSMARVLPAPAAQEWRGLAQQLPTQLRFGVSTCCLLYTSDAADE